jgi:hypothetical protein
MNSFDFVESVVTSALVRSSSAGPSTRRAESGESKTVSSPFGRPSSASSAGSTVSTLPAAGTNGDGQRYPVPKAQGKLLVKELRGKGIGKKFLEPISLMMPKNSANHSPKSVEEQLKDNSNTSSVEAPTIVSAETALLYCQCNSLLQQMPAAVSKLAKCDTLASRNALQMLLMIMSSCSSLVHATGPESSTVSASSSASSSNNNDESVQRRLLAELMNPSLLLQLMLDADGKFVDVARRSALGGAIGAERLSLTPEVASVETQAAKEAVRKTSAAFQAACASAHDRLLAQQQHLVGEGELNISLISAFGSDVCFPLNASDSLASTKKHSNIRTTIPAISEEESTRLLKLARAKWSAHLSYSRALERSALVQFIQAAMASTALAAVTPGISSSFDGKRVLDVLQQRSAEISQQVRQLQRRPSDTKGSNVGAVVVAHGAAASSCEQEHRLTQLLVERDAMRQATTVVEECLRDQRQFLLRLDAQRRAYAESRLAEEQIRKTVQDEAMLRAHADAGMRHRMSALESETHLLKAALKQARDHNEELQRHISALRTGIHLACDEASPSTQRPLSASSALHIATHQRTKGRLTDDQQLQLVSRLASALPSSPGPDKGRQLAGTSLVRPELPSCARCESKHLTEQAGSEKRRSPQRRGGIEGTSPPRPLSELNDQMYYSRKDLRAASVQKLYDRHLSEYLKGSLGDKKTSFTREEVGAIVRRLYVDQIRDKEAMRQKLFELHVASKELAMPRKAAEEINEIVARLAKATD